MLGIRLQQAEKFAKRTFIKYHGYEEDTDGVDGTERFKEDGGWSGFKNKEDYLKWKKHVMGIYRKTKVFCSNPHCSCGNPRRRRGVSKASLSRQELKSQDDFFQQISDFLL